MPTIASLYAEFGARDVGFQKMAKDVERSLGSVDRTMKSVRSTAHATEKSFGGVSLAVEKHASVSMRSAAEIQKGMRNLKASAYGVEKSAGGLIAALGPMAPMIATAFGVGAVMAFGRSILAAAGEAELVTKRLTATLHAQGVTSLKVRDDILAFSDALMGSSTHSDEAITNAQMLLVSLGRLEGDGLKRATRATLDLASGLGIDLASAATLVAKANQGHTEMLGRYGLSFKKTGDRAKDFESVLGSIEGRFKGMAAADAEGMVGAWKQLVEVFDNLKESVGGVAAPFITELALSLKDLVTVFSSSTDLTGFDRLKAALVSFGGTEVARGIAALAWLKRDGGMFGNDTSTSLAADQLATVRKEITALGESQQKFMDRNKGASGDAAAFVKAKIQEYDAKILAKQQELEWAEDAVISTQGRTTLNKVAPDLTDAQKSAANLRAEYEANRSALDLMNASYGTLRVALNESGSGFDKLRVSMALDPGAMLDNVGGIALLALEMKGATLHADDLAESTNAIADAMKRVRDEVERRENEKTNAVKDIANEAIEKKRLADAARAHVTTGGAFVDQVKDGANVGLVRNVIDGAASGKEGGPIGMAVGAMTALLVASEGFRAVLESVNGILQSVADTLGAVVAPLAPVLKRLGDAIRPILDTLGPLLSLLMELNPAFMLFALQVKALAWVVNLVKNSILDAMIGFLAAVKKALKKIHVSWGGLNDTLDALKDARDGVDELGDAARDTAGALTNAAEGFKYALAKFNATTPEEGGPGGGRNPWPGNRGGGYLPAPHDDWGPGTATPVGMTNSAATSGSGGGITITGPIYVQGVEDPEGFFRKLQRLAEREGVRQRGALIPARGF